jgi:hypothetical protein
MKNADFQRIITTSKYLVEVMDISGFDLRKLIVIQQLLTFDKLIMLKLRHHSDQLKGQVDLFAIPDSIFQHVASYV